MVKHNTCQWLPLSQQCHRIPARRRPCSAHPCLHHDNQAAQRELELPVNANVLLCAALLPATVTSWQPQLFDAAATPMSAAGVTRASQIPGTCRTPSYIRLLSAELEYPGQFPAGDVLVGYASTQLPQFPLTPPEADAFVSGGGPAQLPAQSPAQLPCSKEARTAIFDCNLARRHGLSAELPCGREAWGATLLALRQLALKEARVACRRCLVAMCFWGMQATTQSLHSRSYHQKQTHLYTGGHMCQMYCC
jgi:hypothetical protein